MKRLLDIITDANIMDNPSAPTEEVGTFVLDMARCPGGVPDCILERFPNIPKIHAEDLTKVTFYAYWTKEGVTPALAAYELDRADVCCGIRSNSTCMLGDILHDFPEVRERLRSMGKNP